MRISFPLLTADSFGDWTQKERIERWNISVQWQSTRRQSMLYDGLLEVGDSSRNLPATTY